MDDNWDKPLKGTKQTAYYYITQALGEAPGLSMLTEDALKAIAVIAVLSLPVEENHG